MRARSARVALLALVIAGSGAALATVGPTSARAATGRTLAVAPATDLGNQVVLAHWEGFNPRNEVIVQQCKAAPITLADCETAQPFPNSENGNEVVHGVTQADGTGEAFIEVRPAGQLPLLGCSATTACSLIAYENDGKPIPPDGLPRTLVIAPIAFAKTAADCPPVQTFDVRAEGEASSSRAFSRWIAGLCTADPKLIVDYTETASVAGREDFLANTVDLGVTSTAATTDELAAGGHRTFTYAPVDLTSVAVVYNMTDPVTRKRITDLTLSARLLTRIITDSGLLDFFNDPELNHLNPGHHWPSNGLSVPLVRAERNADTLIATSWMASDANAKLFLSGNDPDHVPVQINYKDYPYPTDQFEDVDSNTAYVPRQGENEVAQRVFYGATPTGAAGLPTDQYGFVGLVDLPTAQRYNLPVAKLVNASGNAVAADTAGILAGYAAMKTDPDGITKFPDLATTDPAAYPLVKVDYAMVPTSVDATLAASLTRFLTFTAGPGQALLPDGFVPMPSDLAAQTTAAVAAIKIATSPPPPTTTTTTVPSTTSTTVPVGDQGGTSGAGFGTGTGNDTSPPATPSSPAGAKPTAHDPGTKTATLAKVHPIVDVSGTGERFGLPIIAVLALLGALYPLKRRISPLVGRAAVAVRTRIRRPAAVANIEPS